MPEWRGHGQLCISPFQDKESCVERFHLDPTGFESQGPLLLVLRPPTAFSLRHAACKNTVNLMWNKRHNVLSFLWQLYTTDFGIQDNLFCVTTRLRAERPKNRSSVLGRTRDIYRLQRVRISCGAHLASYSVGSGGFFLAG